MLVQSTLKFINKACESTENLLNSIYEQYNKYLVSKKADIKTLSIKKSENNFTRKNSSSNKKYKKKGNETGEFLKKTKHKSDSKKLYNNSRLMSPNFDDSYGMYDMGMQNKSAYKHPTALNRIGGGNTSNHYMSNFAGRKLFPGSFRKEGQGKDPYLSHTQPDFN